MLLSFITLMPSYNYEKETFPDKWIFILCPTGIEEETGDTYVCDTSMTRYRTALSE
jgi:glycerol uptake facilitator-like aquaporin